LHTNKRCTSAKLTPEIILCDLQLHARLLRALASSDPSRPASLAQGLPSLTAEIRGIDVDALEEVTLLSTRRAGARVGSVVLCLGVHQACMVWRGC